MKYTLFDPYFGLSLKVSIRKDKHELFRFILDSDRKTNGHTALDCIRTDVHAFISGFEPDFISKYTAKRIITFFAASSQSDFIKPFDYANR